jgi:tetratricopeptide (TPR) repeat protein
MSLRYKTAGRIAIALNTELIANEATRGAENPDAVDFWLQGRAASARAKTAAVHAEAIALFERALALNPRSAATQASLASELAGRVLNNMTVSPNADIARAEQTAGFALAAEPRIWWAHMAKAQVLRAQARFKEAIPEYETVIELNRNAAYAYFLLGQSKLFMGSLDEVIPLQLQFIRFSPRDHLIGMAFSRIGTTHLLRSRIEDAIVWLEKARNASPDIAGFRALLASAYALEGSAERATVELAAARSLSADNRFESIAKVRAAGVHAASGFSECRR